MYFKGCLHPSRDTNKKIFFYFNYNTQNLQNIFSTQEQERYNFECKFLDNSSTITLD